MTTIRYRLEKDIPVLREVDVCVVGGGPGGLGAAVTAARQGVSVLLVERYAGLGGMAWQGEVEPFMPNHASGKTLDRPIYGEWREAMYRYLPPKQRQTTAFDPEAREWVQMLISKDTAMLAAEDLCLAAGVRLLYHHTLCDVVKRDGRIEAAVFQSKSGLAAVKAKIFVDGTGDGDLSMLAGCPFEYGNEDGFCQPMTLCFKLCDIDVARMPKREEINAVYQKAKESGELSCPRENILIFGTLESDVIHFNTTRVIKKNATLAAELSEAEVEARRQMRQILDFMRKRVAGFEEARIHSVATHIGVRESRRIRGRQYLTVADFEQARKFPDAIARVSYPIDIHNPSGSGTIIKHVPEGDWYEIPYGCIVPQGCDNLLVGMRGISVDHALHSSMRVMPPVCSIGQAAGMAAASAAQCNCKPAELDGVEIRKKLVAFGANL